MLRNSISIMHFMLPAYKYTRYLFNNKVGLNGRLPISPEKSFSDLNEIWYLGLGRGQWVPHDGMPYDSLQSQGHGRLKCVTGVWKWPISKSVSSAGMHIIKRLMVNLNTPWQYLNFNPTDFLYSSLFGVTWPSNVGVPTMTNGFCLLWGVDHSPVWHSFIIIVLLSRCRQMMPLNNFLLTWLYCLQSCLLTVHPCCETVPQSTRCRWLLKSIVTISALEICWQ